jgi:SAM-dependent methyltransferase
VKTRLQSASRKSQVPNPKSQVANRKSQIGAGWEGWDQYAPFYDWENARTLGRRDVAFWQSLAGRFAGPVLELGCGTGRVSLPLARAGIRLVGVDRSAEMIGRARERQRRSRRSVRRPALVRGDIRELPFGPVFPLVIAPYGILQSLVREADLRATLKSVASVLQPGGTFALDLVPDLLVWQEYKNRVRLRGWRGRGADRRSHITLVESVRQDRARQLTVFEQEYIERRDGDRTARRFTLTFRTLSVPQMRRRLERAGFTVSAVLGDYNGGPWDPRADVWIVVATRGEQ